MDLVGKYIGSRYEVIEKVGNGGMATVYKAKDNVLNRFVAIKVLKDEYTTDLEFIRRFNAEAQSAAGLTHPNIVSVYDVGQEFNIYFIVMELIQGKTLKQIIVEDGALPWKWSINIALQIASALEAAHKNNIVHRDIKPHNIIITEDGVAKVTDFGIAKAVSNSTITAFGTTIGSVHYFSPEHAKGGFTDAKSDLYSLGVVMYEMLTGRVPFDADTPVSVALKHMQEKPTEPMKLNPSIPFAVNQIIMKAMQKEPSLRYQSATEMIGDLNQALKNPEGGFIKDGDETGATQVIETISEERTSRTINNKKKKGKIASFFEKHPKAKIPMAIIGCILLFIITIFITKLAMDAGTVKDVQIPELVGKTEQEIKEMFKGTKFTYEIVGEEYDNEVEEGLVAIQTPKFRERFSVKENTKFEIVISKGRKTVIMPKVEGEKIETARKMLEDLDANLSIEIVEEESTKVEPGIVLKQDIEKDKEIEAGTQITLTVSKAKEQVSVPYLTGKTEDAAKKEVEEAKLKVSIKYEEDTSKESGIVIAQDKEGGTAVDEGTTITITVNKIDASKDCKVEIDIASVTAYTKKQDEEGNDLPAENVTVKVLVNGSVYDTGYSKRDSKSYSTTISSKGTVTIQVVITGTDGKELATKTRSGVNLNTTNTVSFN